MKDTYYSRFLQSYLIPPGSEGRADRVKRHVKLVLGARQTGKSTLLHHCARDGKSTRSINLQDRNLRRRYEAEEGLLVRELKAMPDIDTVIIDEIQKVPALLDDVQLLFDEDPSRFQFHLTGSSARQLKRKSANLLPGRVHSHVLSPVLQAEQRKAEILPLHMSGGHTFPTRTLEQYLTFGNLPGLYKEHPSDWPDTLSAYAELYIESEIRQEHVVADMGAFVRFLRLAALESGQCVNFSKLASDVGVAANTLRNFYQVLEDTYVGIRIQPFVRSRKRIIQSPRFLIFDLGVRHVLADLPLNNALLKLDAGHIFEQWVLLELHYRARYMGKGYGVSTWSTATGAEVDAIVETPDEAIPVEVKWTDNPSPRDAQHVETFIKLHSTMSRHGYVVCRCPTRQQLTDNVIAIPWNEF
jgi:predicted AAA+ superfamily ATPase